MAKDVRTLLSLGLLVEWRGHFYPGLTGIGYGVSTVNCIQSRELCQEAFSLDNVSAEAMLRGVSGTV